MLFHLEVGDAVAQQAAGLGVLLEDMNVVAGAGKLLRAGKARRAGADDGDLSCRSSLGGGSGLIQPLRESAVDDRAFDRLDRHRAVAEVERAGGLARRRANAAGEFREIVGRVEIARGLFPIAADRRGRSSRGSGC